MMLMSNRITTNVGIMRKIGNKHNRFWLSWVQLCLDPPVSFRSPSGIWKRHVCPFYMSSFEVDIPMFLQGLEPRGEEIPATTVFTKLKASSPPQCFLSCLLKMSRLCSKTNPIHFLSHPHTHPHRWSYLHRRHSRIQHQKNPGGVFADRRSCRV